MQHISVMSEILLDSCILTFVTSKAILMRLHTCSADTVTQLVW